MHVYSAATAQQQQQQQQQQPELSTIDKRSFVVRQRMIDFSHVGGAKSQRPYTNSLSNAI